MAEDESGKSPRPFDVKTIKNLLALMDQHDLNAIDLREGTQRIRLRRGAKQGTAAAAPAVAPSVNATAPAAPVAPKPEKAGHAIKSPTPGTFYTGPNPESPAFVSVGSRVTAESVVCIIEAMKIYNEIHAECTGVITKILVENAQPVEYGQVLFEVDPAA